jgi:hypothetical protein
MPLVLIRVASELPEGAMAPFPQFRPIRQETLVTLTGSVVDQEELQGVLNFLNQIGIAVVEVVVMPEGASAR